MLSPKKMIKIVWIVGLFALGVYFVKQESISIVGHQRYFISDSIILRSIAEISNYTEGSMRTVGGLTVTGDFTKGAGLESIESLIKKNNANHFYFMLGMHFYSGRNKYEGKILSTNNILTKIDIRTCNNFYPDIVGDLNFLIEQGKEISFLKKYCFEEKLNQMAIDEKITVLSRLISRTKSKELDPNYSFLNKYVENEYLKRRDTFTDIDSLYEYSQFAFWLWNSEDTRYRSELLQNWPFLKGVEVVADSTTLVDLNRNLATLINDVEFNEQMFNPKVFKILKNDFLVSGENNFYHYANNRLRIFTLLNARRFKNLKLKDLDFKLDNNFITREKAQEIESKYLIPFYKKISKDILKQNPNAKIVIFQYPGFEIDLLKKELSDKNIEIVSVDNWLNLKNRNYYDKFVDDISNSGHFTKELSHEFSQRFIKSYLN